MRNTPAGSPSCSEEPAVARHVHCGACRMTALIAKGEYLARAGDCIACHTNPGGALFAGGLAMPTPFGTLYSSNITPDRETGIGTWTADQFYAALHTGRFPGWRPDVSGHALRVLHQGHACRFRRDLRVSSFGAAGAPAEPAAGPAFPLSTTGR